MVGAALTNVKMGFNESRETVLKHCLDFLKHVKKSPVTKIQIQEFESLLYQMRIAKDHQFYFRKASRCVFLYNVRSLVPLMFRTIF